MSETKIDFFLIPTNMYLFYSTNLSIIKPKFCQTIKFIRSSSRQDPRRFKIYSNEKKYFNNYKKDTRTFSKRNDKKKERKKKS